MNTFEKRTTRFRDAMFGLTMWAILTVSFALAAADRARSAATFVEGVAHKDEVKIGNFLAFLDVAAGRATPAAALAEEAASKNEVKIDNFTFEPPTITVSAGTKVIWTNKDDEPHTVVNTDGKFKSDALDTDDQFSFTFSEPGTYDYYCSVHPKMTGKVIVK